MRQDNNYPKNRKRKVGKISDGNKKLHRIFYSLVN